MKARIYKMLLNGKECMDSYTVWFKPTKKAAANGAHINARHCNVIGDEIWGYWGDYPYDTKIGLDIRLGKRMKDEQVPKPLLNYARRMEKLFNDACVTGNWDKWNNA